MSLRGICFSSAKLFSTYHPTDGREEINHPLSRWEKKIGKNNFQTYSEEVGNEILCFNRIQSLENLKLKKTKLSPASKIFRALPHSEGFVLAAQVNGEYFYHFAKTRKMLSTALTSSHILHLEDESKNWKKRKKKTRQRR